MSSSGKFVITLTGGTVGGTLIPTDKFGYSTYFVMGTLMFCFVIISIILYTRRLQESKGSMKDDKVVESISETVVPERLHDSENFD